MTTQLERLKKQVKKALKETRAMKADSQYWKVWYNGAAVELIWVLNRIEELEND